MPQSDDSMQPTSDPRWLRVRDLFEGAFELPPAERERWVGERVGDDEALRAEVLELLAIEQRSSDFMAGETSASSLGLGADTFLDRLVGRELAGYTIDRLIAKGGMGAVYQARQRTPRRDVALKTLARPDVSADAHRRFRLEVEVLGRLQHPGIARIYDGGTLEIDGHALPYLAMELVSGARDIVDFANVHDLDVRARVELFRTVCDAVHEGHRLGIVHRDLKPANLLVDQQGRAKVIDFGLARVLDEAASEFSSMHTLEGRILGTLEYMSPEHVSGRPEQVDVRSDVYSLGCVLFELTSGRTPRKLRGLSISQAIHRIEREAIAEPRELPRPLRAIVMACLEHDPDRRYVSAAALSMDLQRWLAGQTVLAQRARFASAVASFSRRNRALLLGSLGVIAALAIGLVFATREARRANDASRDATSEAESAYAIGDFLSSMTSAVNAYDRGEDVRVVDMLEQGDARLDEVVDPRAAAVARAVVGAGFLNLGQLQRARELLVPAVERLEALAPSDAPTRLQAEAALAQLLEQEGRFDEAILLARRILPRAEARFGSGAALPCTVQTTLGLALHRSGSFDEAEAVFRAVMPWYERNRARNARTLATMHDRLGQVHLARRELEPAERELVAARELLAEVGAEGSLQATSVAMTLSQILAAQHDIEGVLAVLQGVRRQFLARKGTARNVCEVTLFIVQTLLQLQRPAEAQEELAPVRAICMEVEAQPGPLTHSLITTEARTALVVGDFETARNRALEALELGGTLVPQGHPHDHINRVVLSAAQEGLGRIDEALASLAAGAAPAEAVYGRTSIEYFKLRRIGVELLLRAGRRDDANAHARATLTLLPPDTADPIPSQWHEALVHAGARLGGS